MTENKRFKRFAFADGFKIVAIRDNGEIMNSKKVCEKLNELNDENQRLKNDCSILVQSNQEYRKENEQLKEENKELKEEKKGFESCSHNWGVLYDEAKNKVEELNKENQKLKQFIGAIYDLIDGYIAIADEYRKPIKSLSIGDDLGYWNGVYQYMKKLRERIGAL